MLDHEQQDGSAAPAAPATAPLTAQGAARRRLAGLGVSGVVMTVASNHAMAALVCKSPSGALSGNLASAKPNVSCNGASPKYWVDHLAIWPTEVHSEYDFSYYFTHPSNLSGYKTLHVLKGHPKDTNSVGMYIMATYLNVCSGRITFLTRQAVKDMWSNYCDHNGMYMPTNSTTPWSGAQLVSYLSSTMNP